MAYTADQVSDLYQRRDDVLRSIEDVQLQAISVGHGVDRQSQLREHLHHGVARRLGVISRAITNIFTLFPPEIETPLDSDSIKDVNINLHAFLANLSGIFDNWAWTYVLQHNMQDLIAARTSVGMFLGATQRRLPKPLRDHLDSVTMKAWHRDYAKAYRDALAHRIPPYVPPAVLTPGDQERHRALESERDEELRRRNWDRVDEIWEELNSLGTPCFGFLHAFNEDTPARPLALHPQVICDAMTVCEFGELFFRHWREAPTPALGR